ncbi:hypothetical protein [Nisaea sediminum]|uniref:hypothetical protein n=1 Tax=Nisaea sediminum TaxID=2775867 RepID=UPI001865D8E9|nr:hypothetical protein [Nisaea sediminum]
MSLANTPIISPERDTLSAFFSAVDARLAAFGLEGHVRDTWSGLRAFWEACGYHFFEGYTEEANPDGFWLDIRKDGRTIASGGGFPIVPLETLREHLEVAGLTADPADVWVTEGEARTACEAIRGTTVFTGAIAVDPDHCGTALSDALVHKLIPPAIRAIGMARWSAPHYVFFVKEGRRVAERFRAEHTPVPRVSWYRKPEDAPAEARDNPANWTLQNHHVLGYSSPAFVLERCREVIRSQSQVSSTR